jgi:hypothetical protein
MLHGVDMDRIAGLDDATLVGNTDYFAFLRVELHHPLFLRSGIVSVLHSSISYDMEH